MGIKRRVWTTKISPEIYNSIKQGPWFFVFHFLSSGIREGWIHKKIPFLPNTNVLKTFHNSNFSRNIMVFLLIVIAISRNVKDRDKTARPRFKTLILTLHLKVSINTIAETIRGREKTHLLLDPSQLSGWHATHLLLSDSHQIGIHHTVEHSRYPIEI